MIRYGHAFSAVCHLGITEAVLGSVQRAKTPPLSHFLDFMKLLHLSLGGKLSSLAFFSLRQSKPPTEYSCIFNSNCSEANVVQ